MIPRYTQRGWTPRTRKRNQGWITKAWEAPDAVLTT